MIKTKILEPVLNFEIKESDTDSDYEDSKIDKINYVSIDIVINQPKEISGKVNTKPKKNEQ